MNKKKLAGVIVFYNPEEKIITNNINLYLNSLNKLFIVDNSREDNSHLLKNIISQSKIIYLPQFENTGIAAALNIAATRAYEDGYEYLLTMDQDSEISSQNVESLFEKINNIENIAIISPGYIIKEYNKWLTSGEGVVEVDKVMTSGNIVNLHAWAAIGGYSELLYMDYVDYEFCLNLRSKGYKIFQDNSNILYQHLGNTKRIKILKFHCYPSNYYPIRLFYKTRNRFYLKKIYKNKFPKVIGFDMRMFWAEVFKIILFEKNKIRKIAMVIKGYIYYLTKRMGKIY